MNTHIVNPVTDIPGAGAQAQDWINWFQAMDKSPISRANARVRFMNAWKIYGSSTANNEALRRYLRKKGISLEADWQDVVIEKAEGVLALPLKLVGGVNTAIVIAGVLVLALLIGIIMVVRKAMANPELLDELKQLKMPTYP